MNGLPAYIISNLEKELENLPATKNQETQHLIELGYISLQKANALTRRDISTAQEQFLDELETSGLFTDQEIRLLMLQGKDYLMQTVLRKITDIDEGILLNVLPQRGEKNLATRMIHYRFDLFGMWPMDVSAPWSNLSLGKLDEIAEFAKSSPMEALNHLADMEQFTRHLLEKHPPEKFILVFKSPKVKRETKKQLDRRQAFKRQMIDDFGERTEFVRHMARNVLKNRPEKVDFRFLQHEAKDPFKRFVMRLLQIHQWQDGFYSGLLDSDMGEVTLASFLQTINFYNESDGRQIKTHRAITYAHKGFFIFNSLFFLQEYMVEDENPASEEAVLESISKQIAETDESGRQDFAKNLDKLKADIYDDAKREPKERKGLLQRIYFGIKRFIKKAFRFARKIFNWIKDKVEKAWGFLKGLFRNFFEKLQFGIRAFVDGIRFIFGKKGIESAAGGELIFSKFSIDGDSVSISTTQISAVLEQHLQKVGYNINSMEFTLTIVAGILKLIISMVAIITWPLLLFNIIKVYKNISSAYQDLANAA